MNGEAWVALILTSRVGFVEKILFITAAKGQGFGRMLTFTNAGWDGGSKKAS